MKGRGIIGFLIILIIISIIGVSAWKFVVNKDNSLNEKTSENEKSNALDIKDTIDRYNTAKKNAFHVEAQTIYKQVSINLINDDLISKGPFNYCQSGPSLDNVKYSANNCKPLSIDTPNGYYIENNSSYKVSLFIVYSDLYYVVKKNINSVIDIKVDDIKEIRSLSGDNKLNVSSNN